MKPSKKKLATKFKLDFSFDDIDTRDVKIPKKIDYQKFSKVLMQNENNEVTQGFVFEHNGNPIIIAEPDPCLIFFTTAEGYLSPILKLKESLFENYGSEKINSATEIFFVLFPLAATFIITLFASIEAFQNGSIPIDYTYRHKRKTHNRLGIQRFVDFSTKMNVIIPNIFNKSFVEDKPEQSKLLEELKLVRNNIIHTKNLSKGFPDNYGGIFRSTLNVNYKSIYSAAKDYINYYKPNWIEEDS